MYIYSRYAVVQRHWNAFFLHLGTGTYLDFYIPRELLYHPAIEAWDLYLRSYTEFKILVCAMWQEDWSRIRPSMISFSVHAYVVEFTKCIDIVNATSGSSHSFFFYQPDITIDPSTRWIPIEWKPEVELIRVKSPSMVAIYILIIATVMIRGINILHFFLSNYLYFFWMLDDLDIDLDMHVQAMTMPVSAAYFSWSC